MIKYTAVMLCFAFKILATPFESMDPEGQFQTLKSVGEQALFENLSDIADSLSRHQALPQLGAVTGFLEENQGITPKALNDSWNKIQTTFSPLMVSMSKFAGKKFAGNEESTESKNDYELGISRFAAGLLMLKIDPENHLGKQTLEAGLSDLLTYTTGGKTFFGQAASGIDLETLQAKRAEEGEAAEAAADPYSNRFLDLEADEKISLIKLIAQSQYRSVLSHHQILQHPLMLDHNFFKSALCFSQLEGRFDTRDPLPLLQNLIIEPFKGHIEKFIGKAAEFIDLHGNDDLQAFIGTGQNYMVLNQLQYKRDEDVEITPQIIFLAYIDEMCQALTHNLIMGTFEGEKLKDRGFEVAIQSVRAAKEIYYSSITKASARLANAQGDIAKTPEILTNYMKNFQGEYGPFETLKGMFKVDDEGNPIQDREGKQLPNLEHWNWGECVFGYDRMKEVLSQSAG